MARGASRRMGTISATRAVSLRGPYLANGALELLEIAVQAALHCRLEISEDGVHVPPELGVDRSYQAFPAGRELETHGAPVFEVAPTGDVAGTLQTVENTRHGLGLLREVICDQVRLRTVERIDREKCHGLDESNVVFFAQPLVKFAYDRVRCAIKSGHQSKIRVDCLHNLMLTTAEGEMLLSRHGDIAL